MTKPIVNIWGETASIAPLTPQQQSQGYAYTAAKPGELKGKVETDDLDFPMKQATTAIDWMMGMLSENGGLSKNNGSVDLDANGVPYFTNNLSSASADVGGQGWSRIGEVISNNNSIKLSSGFTIKFGSATTGGSAPSSVAITFDEPYLVSNFFCVAIRVSTSPSANTETTVSAPTLNGFSAHNSTGNAPVLWMSIGI
ncbi:hypothetical protein NVP1123O_22 [Vibrio phage 1.123.O._10N.286.48.F3]|nr:hypothetical protein NVP1123O_22 [Vibrio phage 1.123.O._10N.286.48.F3]